MHMTITIDDELLSKAREATGLQETDAVVKAALMAVVQHNAAQKLIELGGSDPDATAAPRRRWKSDGTWQENHD